jgi:hypothetical protein
VLWDTSSVFRELDGRKCQQGIERAANEGLANASGHVMQATVEIRLKLGPGLQNTLFSYIFHCQNPKFS